MADIKSKINKVKGSLKNNDTKARREENHWECPLLGDFDKDLIMWIPTRDFRKTGAILWKSEPIFEERSNSFQFARNSISGVSLWKENMFSIGKEIESNPSKSTSDFQPLTSFDTTRLDSSINTKVYAPPLFSRNHLQGAHWERQN